MTGDMGDTGTTVRRKKGNKVSLSVNVTKKEKRTREVVGAESVKGVEDKEEIVTESVEDELTEKLATLLERDRSGVSWQVLQSSRTCATHCTGYLWFVLLECWGQVQGRI